LAGRGGGSLNFSYINESERIDTASLGVDEFCFVSVLDSMESLSGIMSYSFGNFKLLPRNNDDVAGYAGANCPDGVSDTTTTHVGLPQPEQFRVYPNPVQNELTVAHEVAAPQGLRIQLLDLTGRPVLRMRSLPQSARSTLSVSGLSAGLYLLRVSHGTELLLSEKVRVE
jgi:hypothetical protein